MAEERIPESARTDSYNLKPGRSQPSPENILRASNDLLCTRTESGEVQPILGIEPNF
jgi:hypothetical protein